MYGHGYLINYIERTSFFFREVPGDNMVIHRDVFCTHAALIELLQNPKITVDLAIAVNIDERLQNHPEIHYEFIGFEGVNNGTSSSK